MGHPALQACRLWPLLRHEVGTRRGAVAAGVTGDFVVDVGLEPAARSGAVQPNSQVVDDGVAADRHERVAAVRLHGVLITEEGVLLEETRGHGGRWGRQ